MIPGFCEHFFYSVYYSDSQKKKKRKCAGEIRQVSLHARQPDQLVQIWQYILNHWQEQRYMAVSRWKFESTWCARTDRVEAAAAAINGNSCTPTLPPPPLPHAAGSHFFFCWLCKMLSCYLPGMFIKPLELSDFSVQDGEGNDFSMRQFRHVPVRKGGYVACLCCCWCRCCCRGSMVWQVGNRCCYCPAGGIERLDETETKDTLAVAKTSDSW